MKLLIGLCLPIAVFAGTIDFQTALDKTLQNNKSLKAKRLDIEVSKQSLEEAKGYSYGNLVFSENVSRTNSAAYVFVSKLSSREADFGDFGFSDFLTPMGAAISGAANGVQPSDMSSILDIQPDDLNYPDDRTNYETKVKYEIPLFTGFKLDSAQKMAKLQLLANQAKYSFDEKQLSLEVLKAYNGAVAAKEFMQATKKAKEATAAFVELANELFKEGLVTSIDVKQARVYDIGVDASIIEAENRFNLAIAYLKFLTNDDSINDIKEFKTVSKQLSLQKELKSKALQNREDFKWMDYNKKTMKEKINYEASENYLQVGAMVEYGFNDDTFSVSRMDEHDYYLAAVGISYKMFDGFVTKAKKEKAKIEHKKMEHLYEYMKEGIKLEVEKNILNLKAKKKIYEQKQLTQNLADEVLDQSTQMYKNHLISMNDLLMQQANNQKAIAETIFAKYEESLAAATLKLSLGESLKDIKE